MKKIHTLLFALGLGFMVFLIWHTGLHTLWAQVTLLGWGLVPILLAEGLAEFFHAISWRYCFGEPHRRISVLRLFRIHMAGYALNFLTPTATVAGEITKGALVAGHRKGSEAAAAVLIGKLSFGIGHALFVLIGLVFVLPGLEMAPALRYALLLSSALLGAGIAVFLILQKGGHLSGFLQWFIERRICPGTLNRFAGPMERVDVALREFHQERPGDLVLSVLWHLLGYTVGIFAVWYFLFLLGQHQGLMTAARIWFLSLWVDLVTFMIPLNLGALEGGRLVAFRSFGAGALPGLTYAVVTRIAQLIWAGVGLVNLGFLVARAVWHTPAPLLSRCPSGYVQPEQERGLP